MANNTPRIGMLGLDTSHVAGFAQLLNDPALPHHIAGARVVAGWAGGSPDFELSWSRVGKFTTELRDSYGAAILDSPEAVAETCDLLFIMAADGRVHRDLFARTMKFKRPTFIDKPLATNLAEARDIFAMAEDSGVPLMSASAMRYIDPFVAAMNSEHEQTLGKILGCDAFGPLSIEKTQGRWFWYGIHTVEMIVAAMGAGCRRVRVIGNESADVVELAWSDGRLATMRGNLKGHKKFALTLHRERNFQSVTLPTDSRPVYAGLVEAILRSLPLGRSDVPMEQTLEVIRILEACDRSHSIGDAVELA